VFGRPCANAIGFPYVAASAAYLLPLRLTSLGLGLGLGLGLHASHACPVYIQLMSSFKQLYAHQGLQELSRDCSVSPIVSSIIKHGRFRVQGGGA
jgi:hypothetical protein